jgi:hypothetical protein
VIHGDAYSAVRHVYDRSPGGSWARLNSALDNALTAAIIGHLSFLPDDFAAIASDMRGSYWMGNSEGSTTGERYYGLAVRSGHVPACISFERYSSRPAALWCETAKTPERLCIGKRFTWNGKLVTVTNMKESYLVACTYSYGGRGDGIHVGDSIYADGYRNVLKMKPNATGIVTLTLSAPAERLNEKPTTITKITYADLTSTRKQFDALRKEIMNAVRAADSKDKIAALRQRIASTRGNFRAFDLVDIRDAIAARERDIA